ncbi:ABC transporter permease [Dehalobacter sp. DCM]|uniref:ABC transporter permease n=1 Tax=Dehalobacter sp. DCM TaxID=2907827 RepID=UPI0030814B1E|nr:ABC transporter permease [Dehalobacter sp. DCM]
MKIGNIQFEKKQTVSLRKRILNPIVCVVLALVFSSLLIIANGFDPIAVYAKMISYSFLNARGLYNSINAALPLMFCGLSVAMAFKMNLNNIGAEGQYAIGAIFGGGFAIFGPALPTPLNLLVMFLLCALGGGLWAMIAAVLKAYWKVNETIVTLMLNYIALLFLDYLCYGPWMAPRQTTAMTTTIPKSMYLPSLGGTSSGVLLAIGIAILLLLFLKHTTGGYQIGVIRNSTRSAEYAGIPVKRYILIVFALSGALAGLAGFVEVTGIVHRVQAQLPGGSGYTGIVVAYLSQFNPLVVILVSILFGGLQNSCAAVQLMGVPSQIATMLQGTIMIFVIAGEFLNHYKITYYSAGNREVSKR